MINEELARQYALKESGLWCNSPWFKSPELSIWFDRIFIEQMRAYQAGLEHRNE